MEEIRGGFQTVLGPDHRFPTTVKAGPTPTEVILVAGGDPLLTSADLRELAENTAQALPEAIGSDQRITVRADDSLFQGGGISRGWYSSWVPSEVRRVGAFARDDRKVSDSTADAGAYFARALRRLDVRATYAGESLAAPDAPTIATFAGHSVGEAVSRALLISDNDTAEMLFRQVAVARGIKAFKFEPDGPILTRNAERRRDDHRRAHVGRQVPPHNPTVARTERT